MNTKRMGIALIVAALFGAFCAYGTYTADIPGFEVTLPYLLTIFYSRLMIGLVIGLSEDIKLLKNETQNSITRGALMGGIVSIGISFFGGAEIFIAFGIVYGILTDFLATKFGS